MDRLCSIESALAFVARLHPKVILKYAIACSVWVLVFDYVTYRLLPSTILLSYLYPFKDIALIWLGYYSFMQLLARRNASPCDESFPSNPATSITPYNHSTRQVAPTSNLPTDRATNRTLFSRTTAESSQRRNGMSYADLQNALDNQEFMLRYQPILSLGTGRLVGFEALVRWNHPQHGELPPKDFLPIIEPTHLMFQFGWWVMEEACQQLRRWQLHDPSARSLIISVNLSPQQFKQSDLIEQVQFILSKTGLPCTNLKLEVTETMLMENADTAAEMLQRLHDMGVKLAIDDFGTGYSSLGYLYRFPVDMIKIDRSFITNIDRSGEQVELVRTIMTLAWNLGLEAVAEGIETSLQLSQLRALGCQYAQGYLFSKPLTADAATQYIETTTGLPVI